MARPNIKILGGLQEAFQKADEKYGETLREIVRLPDGKERLATAELLVDMLETEIKETKRRLDECRQQEWVREGARVTLSDMADDDQPEPAPPEAEPEKPYPPMPPEAQPEQRESIWSNGALPGDLLSDFHRLTGVNGPLQESKLKKISIKKLLGDVCKKLGLDPTDTKTEYGHMTSIQSTPVERHGETPAFTVTHDTSRQTGMEVMGFEIEPDAYRKIKNILPAHKLDSAKYKGRLMARPTERLGAN